MLLVLGHINGLLKAVLKRPTLFKKSQRSFSLSSEAPSSPSSENKHLPQLTHSRRIEDIQQLGRFLHITLASRWLRLVESGNVIGFPPASTMDQLEDWCYRARSRLSRAFKHRCGQYVSILMNRYSQVIQINITIVERLTEQINILTDHPYSAYMISGIAST